MTFALAALLLAGVTTQGPAPALNETIAPTS